MLLKQQGLRENANAFGLYRQGVSVIIQQVYKAVTILLEPDYIKILHTEPVVNELVAKHTVSYTTVPGSY